MNRSQRITAGLALLALGMFVPGSMDRPGETPPSTVSPEPATRPLKLAQADTDPARASDAATPAEDSAPDAGRKKKRTTPADENKPVEAAGAAASTSGGPDDATDQPPGDSDAGRGSMRTTVPEGFKALTEPQKTMVDVSFGDRQITSTLVEYTPETIRFLRPEEVIRSLPNVQRRDELLKHFRGEQPTHSGQVCVGAKQKDCGRLEPDHIGVIFDERRFHAEVFVNPDYLADVDKETGSYLGTPDKPELGLVQNLNFNHAGSNPGSDRSSLFGRTRVGRGSAHAFSSWVRTGEQKLSVDELGLRKDFKKHQLNMGLYQPRNDQLTILQRQPLIGAGIKRSFKRERGRTATFATELEVVLNGRARVELIKDGRLYDARPYEAGRRSLDTARLPPGAYNLKIRITESSGRTRTLERFFVKSRSLAPTDENLWFANAGRLQRRNRDELFPEDGGTLLTSAGVQHRYRDGIGLGLAAAAIEDEALLETTLDWLTADGQAHASFFADSEGGAGWLLRGSASLAEARLIFDSQRVWTQSEPPTPDYALLPDRIERDRLELRLPARKGSYFVSWRRLQRNDTAEQRTSTLGYTRTLQLGGQQSLNLNAALTRTNGVHEARLAVNWRLTRSHWQHQAGLAGRDTDGSGAEPERSASASSTWQDGDTLDDDLQLSAGVETDDSKTRASLDGRYDWQYGRGNAGVSWIRPDEGRD